MRNDRSRSTTAKRLSVLLLTATAVCSTAFADNAVEDNHPDRLIAKGMQGHILLLHDYCHRVLDDPSTINRYSFKTFHQYVNYCVERQLRDTDKPYIKPRLA